jgi:hypothetical protein
MNIIIHKGFNSSLPPLFRAGVDVDWYYEISLNSEYYLVGEDQYDWNKLIGIKERYLQPLFMFGQRAVGVAGHRDQRNAETAGVMNKVGKLGAFAAVR